MSLAVEMDIATTGVPIEQQTRDFLSTWLARERWTIVRLPSSAMGEWDDKPGHWVGWIGWRSTLPLLTDAGHTLHRS